MPKVSKNIKKFRAEKNLTQDALAEKIHVTRQAISNWENDKTKPDIEALEALATALEVEVEELIYGEKKEIIVSQDKTKEKNRIKIILAIVGSLFVASGLALAFFGFWQKFPVALKTVFAFVPILLGQGAAVFTFLKKKDSISWREGAAILWTVGIVATVALLNDIHSINLGYINCLAIDAFLIIPIMFLFDAVSPLIFFLYSAIHVGTEGLWQYIVVSIIIFIVGIVFTTFLSRNKEDSRGKYAQWITTLTGIPLLWIYSFAATKADVMLASENVFFAVYLVAFLCLYIFAPEKSPYSLPYKPISIIGMCITTSNLATKFYVEFFVEDNIFALSINCVFCLLVPLIVALIKIKSFKGNISKILISAIPFSVIVLNFAMIFIKEFSDNTGDFLYSLNKSLEVVIGAVVTAFGVVLIYAGVKELRLLLVNSGLLTAFFQIMRLFYSEIFPESYFLKGAVLVLFGAVIITINWKLLSIKRSLEEKAEGGS